MKRSLRYLTLIAGIACAGQAGANDLFATGLYIAPGANTWDVKDIWDSHIEIQRKGGFNISLGYQFDNPWAVELMYQRSKTNLVGFPADDKLKLSYTHIDALYTFSWFKGSRWATYAVAGIGEQRYASNYFRESDNTLNIGAGVKYAATPKLQIRLDGRGTAGAAHGDIGGNINLGLVYVLGPIYEHYSSSIPVKKIPSQNMQEQEAAPAEPAPAAEEQTAPAAAPVATVVVDSDGDGVADKDDQCANTTAGAKVDEKGCYIVLTQTRNFTLNVTFATGSSAIQADSKSDIRDLAKFLTEYPQTSVVIEGHSDSTGSAALNKRLSQQRADAVKQSLISDFGINAARISSKGFGSEQPIADNSTAEGRAKNRRVVAKVSAMVNKIQEK